VQVAAFRAATERLIGRPLGDDERIAVAVSGGPDSLALLLLAHAAYGGRVQALTVDHGLRPESADEAAQVARLCVGRGIAHETLPVTVERCGEGIQAAAREARYAALARRCEKAGIRWLMTAHHADDQAETLLLRLARGSGLAGMAGIRACRPFGRGVDLLRPLLSERKSALVRIVAEAGIQAVDDPSNRSEAFDRTAARRLLAEADWIDPARVGDTAAHLAEAEAALAWLVEEAWAGRALVGPGEVSLDAEGLPAEVVRRLVLKAVQQVQPAADPDGPALAGLVAALHAGHRRTIAGVLARPGAIWHFCAAPARSASKPPPSAE
jgi:tRNA(Ile)-lysidine synthase